MTESKENKVETLPDLDDLLQCPVCYEIPSGQIFQCNEGHHVCGRCKVRLDVCPVCRAFFFGTRNYAMEELIANVRKLRAFKLGGKVTTGSPPAAEMPEVAESSTEENESTHENANDDDDVTSQTSVRAPTSCKGLFRCLCCKNNPERLPVGRLLNHLRYYHSPDLIESRSENGGYLQAWQFPTAPGKMVTAVRVHDMGIFFLVIEVTDESVYAWLSMAASPWVAHEFSYSFTLSGNDREAIFSDCVWSVRSCEGSLKKRGRCLSVSGVDARALLTPSAMSGKLCVRRAPQDSAPHAQPRAVLRVANRSNAPAAHDLEPFLLDLQNDVARLSRAFATLGREANALVRSEAEMRARLEHAPPDVAASPPPPAPAPAPPQPASDAADRQLSRSARRRMRQRLREAFRVSQGPEPAPTAAASGDASRPAPYRPRPNAPLATDATRQTQHQTARPHTNQAISSNQNAQINRGLNSTQNARSQNNQATRESNEQNSAGVTRAHIGYITVVPGRVNDDQNESITPRVTNGQPAMNTNRSTQGRASPRSGSDVIRSRGQDAVSGLPVGPPSVQSTILGGPSQDRPADGNARNKKKRRQRR